MKMNKINTPLPLIHSPQLNLAAVHGSTKWVQQFIRIYLPQLHDQTITPEEFTVTLEQEFEARGLKTLSQQKNYRSNVVQALKVIDDKHPAIALVSLSTEEYRELNDAQRSRLAERETKYFTSTQAENLVKQATQLLDSSEWSDVGAGLAVLVGRRISEILLSEFSFKSPWSLYFTGMAKKPESISAYLTIEIPTLAPSPRVLKAVQMLQKFLEIEDLKLTSLSAKMAKQKVNQRFSGAIAAKCDQYFGKLIPTRSNKGNLYTHIFRAVYATIAAYWFCPPSVPEHSFKAEIQGHFTITADGTKLPNFSARANYDDYAIGDGQGNRDGRLGIKLGILPELQVIDAFLKPQTSVLHQSLDESMPSESHSETVNERDNEVELQMETQANNSSSLGNSMPVSRAAREDGDRSASPIPEPAALTALDKPIANAIRFRAAGLIAKANPSPAELAVALQILTGLSLTQLAEAQITAINPFQISVDGEPIITLVQQIEPYVQKLRRLPFPSIQDIQQVCEITFHNLPVNYHSLPQLYSLIQTQPIQSTAAMSTSKPKARRPELYAQDLDHMHALMAKFGIGGSSADVFHAFLEAFETTHSQQQQQQHQTLAEVAQTLNWFTSEIEQLRTQLKTLEQERDQLKSNLSTTEALVRLQTENQQLKSQLHQTQSRLESIQNLLGSPQTESRQQTAIAPSPQPPSTSSTLSFSQQEHRKEPFLSPPTTRRSREDTSTRIHQIIDALIAWNSNQSTSQQQLRISIPIIKELASFFGANYQAVIQEILKLREKELEDHHSLFMLGMRHNASISNKRQILEEILRKYLSADKPQTDV
jgi:hypothetical protein